MPRAIDHLVLAVRDLEAARATYARLGFTLTPAAQHPFGTANSLVQMDGSYLELLAVADPSKIPEPTATRFSFGAFNRDYLKSREGLSMLVLHSEDAAADRADFAAHDLPVYEPMTFSRNARGPDGVERSVSFSLAYTSDARVHGQAGFFTCQHHQPENFWRSEYQRHANGAVRVDSAVFVTRDPADFHIFFTWFTGQHDILSTSLHTRFDLGQSSLDVLSPVAFRAFFGEEAGPDPRRFAAYRVAVHDIDATRAHFSAKDVPFAEMHGALVIPSAFAHGAALAFVTERDWDEGLKYMLRLLVSHPTMEPERITRGLGLDPDRVWPVGAPRQTPKGTLLPGVYRETKWSRGRWTRGQRAFFSDVARLLDRLEPHAAFLAELKASGGRVTLNFDLFGEHNIGDVLGWQQMKRLADLKIDVGVEVF